MITPRALLLFALFLAAKPVFAQQDSVRIYYTSEGMITNEVSAASYRDFVKQKDSPDLFLGTGYAMGGKPKSLGYYIYRNEAYYHHGGYREYFEDGTKQSEGLYEYNANKKSSFKTGLWKFYFPNGATEAEWTYAAKADSSATEGRLVSFWDSTGKQLVTGGNGYYYYSDNWSTKNTYFPDRPDNDTSSKSKRLYSGKITDGKFDSTWTVRYGNGKVYAYDEYKIGEFKHGISYDKEGKQYKYDTLEIMPVFPGGETALLDFIRENVNYPKKERNHDVMGKVLVRFTVSKEGRVSDAKIMRGVSKGIDKESLRVVSMLPNFIPGKQRGQPVAVMYNLPISFKLQ